MNPVRILATSDVHFDRENQEQALASLEALLAHGRDNGVDLWCVAGDLFNRAVPNTAAAGFPRLIDILQRMMDIAPVVAVTGTPTHDIPGCYAALGEIKAKYNFTLLDPREPNFLLPDDDVHEVDDDARLLILGCGEPSKEWFLAGKEDLGRDEANQAVVDGMRQLLLGLGAIRRQYAALPCLMVYHGAIEGASLCNGQVLRPGELAIGRDDLALVGADYYALGHIHLAQQVGDLPAYYAGSAYPVNWGEVDQKGFNQVEIGEFYAEAEDHEFADHSQDQWIWQAKAQRIPFPHPPRKKIIVSLEQFDNTNWKKEIGGFQAWVVVKDRKEAVSDLDPAYIASEVLSRYGALPGSRVTVEIIPTETVRAGQIAEARGLDDKLRIYAENSGEKLSDPQLIKAAFLESEARASGQAPEGLHVRIDRLHLRGAIGIWKGLGLDEIDLDLADYDPGLIALVGANGKGKTTLIENMHPYPEMLTRGGTLQEHFRLKDSFRELYFTDERTGSAYRALIQIDGANASGRAEYHLYKGWPCQGAEAAWEPLTNGRKADYEEAIGRLFGSLALFVRSAFVSQKPPKGHPDLTDATKGEKKALFRELAGLDYLQAYSEAAREKAKALEAETERDAGRMQALCEQLSAGAGKVGEREGMKAEAEVQTVRLTDLETQGKAAQAEVEELRQKVERNREIEVRLRELEQRQEKLRGEVEHIERNRADYEQALTGRPVAEKALAGIEALKQEEGRLHAEQAGILRERERLNIEHRNAEKAVADQRKALAAKEAEAARQIAVLDQKKAGIIRRVDELEERLRTKVECPACHHQFHPDAAAVQQRIAQAQAETWATDQVIEETGKILEKIQAEAAQIPPVATLVLPVFDDSRLRKVAEDLASRDEDAARELLSIAADAVVHIQEGQKRKGQVVQEAAELGLQREELKAKLLGPEVEDYYTVRKQLLANMEAVYRKARDTLKALEASLAALERQLAELAERARELEALRSAIAGKQQNAAEWRYLERACGPDGIQALELDAMGPGIAEVANRLLSAAYGSRFAIEFRTTRIGGAGSKKKQIEDFQIAVLDSEHGSEQLLETLSGGEAVWIKRSIYDAFGIIRDRSTGQRFLTVFQDEADGALDPEARLAYFRMLEAAHQEAGRRNTVIITHSQEAQEMIAQRIRMEDLRQGRD